MEKTGKTKLKMEMNALQTEIQANGERVAVALPLSLDAFLRGQNLLPRSVVVEWNGEAVAPSEFPYKMLQAGDRLEIVRIVAGG